MQCSSPEGGPSPTVDSQDSHLLKLQILLVNYICLNEAVQKYLQMLTHAQDSCFCVFSGAAMLN